MGGFCPPAYPPSRAPLLGRHIPCENTQNSRPLVQILDRGIYTSKNELRKILSFMEFLIMPFFPSSIIPKKPYWKPGFDLKIQVFVRMWEKMTHKSALNLMEKMWLVSQNLCLYCFMSCTVFCIATKMIPFTPFSQEVFLANFIW